MRRVILALLASFAIPTVLCGPTGAVSAVHATKVAPRPAAVLASAPRYALDLDAAAHGLTIAELRAEWQRVAFCEVAGNWSMVGPVYSGIGFLNATWDRFGGRRFAPVAGQASRDQQILVGMKVTHGWVPDQDGCSPVGW